MVLLHANKRSPYFQRASSTFISILLTSKKRLWARQQQERQGHNQQWPGTKKQKYFDSLHTLPLITVGIKYF
jgi:hypothetical protein